MINHEVITLEKSQSQLQVASPDKRVCQHQSFKSSDDAFMETPRCVAIPLCRVSTKLA